SPHQGCVRISVFVAVPLSGAKSRARQARPAKCGTHPLTWREVINFACGERSRTTCPVFDPEAQTRSERSRRVLGEHRRTTCPVFDPEAQTRRERSRRIYTEHNEYKNYENNVQKVQNVQKLRLW
ncbi:MAG: hypothetical protein MUO91_06240, partial [candidate division Zixibacteria bacterium]|nr:hypothetical protein [candidate division Zixibacteria bacterium]